MTNRVGNKRNKKKKLSGGCGDVCVGGGMFGGGKKDFKLKFRINSNERARLITFGGKEKFIVGIIAIIFIFTSALKHAVDEKKGGKKSEKKAKNDGDSRGEQDYSEGEGGEDAGRGIKTAVVNGLEMDDYE